jgi:NAD(P)H-dependent flavin oxidoreductase YrpB (nitropropane dioxygenase family)
MTARALMSLPSASRNDPIRCARAQPAGPGDHDVRTKQPRLLGGPVGQFFTAKAAPVPVIAAGGIGDARGVATVLP